ncbi:hypothetical protein GCM10023346_22570 [Arthrobacter gyeryongensis]|uniref:3-isopropylmalate dehydratase small subunit n=1 Tax=Arthrobacter gyeryongensis TaxID=1650592 RepID=A0ABP9SEM1_9MICC
MADTPNTFTDLGKWCRCRIRQVRGKEWKKLCTRVAKLRFEANILIAGPDFGTGSSREHAVWALMDYGFRAVISLRFADIFRGNAAKSGLLAVQVDPQQIEQLWQRVESHPEVPLSIDLDAQTINANHFERTRPAWLPTTISK